MAHEAARRIGHAAVLDLGVRDARPENDRVLFFSDVAKLFDAADVDEQRRLHHAQIEHRAERLSARQELGVVL